MEVLACARLRLFIARGEFETGRDFAAALLAVAAERTLVRIWMRSLVLSMALEREATVALQLALTAGKTPDIRLRYHRLSGQDQVGCAAQQSGAPWAMTRRFR